MRKLTYLLLLTTVVFSSGAYDNGTATGKGMFQLDLTLNPFDRIEFGQTFAVMSYGLTNRIDLHGYISHHPQRYQTWYFGIFYQFYKSNKIDLATAVGIRKISNDNWADIFFPQLLYTIDINNRVYLGGSVVNVKSLTNDRNYGISFDIGLFYQLKYKSKRVESVSIGFGGFHPATWESGTFFLPTYSIDFKFK